MRSLLIKLGLRLGLAVFVALAAIIPTSRTWADECEFSLSSDSSPSESPWSVTRLEKSELEIYLDSLPTSQTSAQADVKRALLEIEHFFRTNHPNSSAAAFLDEYGLKREDLLNVVRTPVEILSQDWSDERKAEELNRWAVSPAHTLFLYDIIMRLPKSDSLLSLWRASSPYFANTLGQLGVPDHDGLLSFGWDMETISKNLDYLFQRPDPDEKRPALFPAYAERKKTALAPVYLGRFKAESADVSELVHRAYEIDKERAKAQVQEMLEFLGKGTNIHFHIVMRLPKKYFAVARQNFIFWHAYLNMYLEFLGLEEGRHFGIHIRPTSREGYNGLLRGPGDSLNPDKMISAGLRIGHPYVRYHENEFQTVGVELRDVTKDIHKLSGIIDRVSESMNRRVWEIDRPLVLDEMNSRYAMPSPEIKSHVLFNFETHIAWPLIQYENGRYFDFQKGKFVHPDGITRQRIIKAREFFLQQLEMVKDEYDAMIARGESPERADVQGALRMILSDWAKRARISELFKY